MIGRYHREVYTGWESDSGGSADLFLYALEFGRQTEMSIEVDPIVPLVPQKRGMEKKYLGSAVFDRLASNREVK